MVRRNGWNTTSSQWSALLLFALIVVLLCVGAGVALLLGKSLGKPGLLAWGVGVGGIVLFLTLALRWYSLAAIIVLAVHIYIDWYLALYIVAPVMTVCLLFILFLGRSAEYPWTRPRGLWLWGLFLALSLYPAWLGADNYYDAAFYYPNIIVGALLFFWLGSVLARNGLAARIIFQLLTGLGTLIALHTIIQAVTGITLLGTASHDTFLAGVSNYQLSGTGIPRVGSFFVDPNWDGAFFATMIFIPLGLLFARSSAFEKLLYALAVFLMLLALLFTYSNGAWLGTFAGAIVFVLVVGRLRYRLLLPIIIIMAAILLEVFFPTQISHQIQHATEPSEVTLRLGIWQTALAVIKANPLTGLGLGHYAYLQRAEIYRVPAQYIAQDHPHNSFLEFAAMAGIPVMLAFTAVLVFTLRQAFRNWARADARVRVLIGAGIASASALTVNSLTINGWTLPPLAALGWLILGVIASPLLLQSSPGTSKQLPESVQQDEESAEEREVYDAAL